MSEIGEGPLAASGSSPPGQTEHIEGSLQSALSESVAASDQDGNQPAQHSPAKHRPLDLLIHRYPLVLFFFVWVTGTALTQFDSVTNLGSPWFALVSLLSAGLLLVFRGSMNKPMKWSLGLILVLSTAAWYSLVSQPIQQDSLSSLANRSSRPVALRGTIVQAAVWSPNPYHRPQDPDSDPWSTRWVVEWDSCRTDQAWTQIQSQSKLTTKGRVSHLLPGDRIEVFGSFEAIAPPTNPGMPNFMRRAQSVGQFITVRTDDPTQIQPIEPNQRMFFQRLRGGAVRYVDKSLHDYVAFDQAPLAAALVFGQREQVDWESQQQLMATGTLHMLAISGMHVEMIAATLLLLCYIFALRRGTIAILIIVVCVGYAGLAGGNPPVLRALLLIVAFTTARYFGWNARLFNLLAFSALVLLWLNTSNLTNVGVHLSFLAVATIAVFNREISSARRNALQRLLEASLPLWRRWALAIGRQFIAGLRISFWVWLFTTPLIWHHFHVVSLVSIPLNVVLSFPLAVGLLAGLATPLVSWLPGAGYITGSLAGFALAIIQLLVNWSYAIPFGHFWLPSPPIWWSVLFYMIALTWLIIGRGTKHWGLAIVMVSWVALGVSLFAFGPRGFLGRGTHGTKVAEQSELRCTFIDVGHGTCAVIELPDGRIWLYDAGHMGVSQRSHEVIASTLWSLGAARIDTLIISHADSDHYNATPGLLQRFRIGKIVSTKRFWESTAREVQLVHQAVVNSGKQRESWNRLTEDPAQSESVLVEVLHPPPNFRAETDNADSLCLQLEYAGTRILLPGDIEGSGMLTLCEQPPRRCDVLMAPHHGSLAHDVSELMEWCDPKVVVISGNERAVRPAVLDRFADASSVGVTFADGAVQVRINSDGAVSTFHWNTDRWSPLRE